MIEIQRKNTPVVDRNGWRYDLENAPRDMAKWLFLAVEINGKREVRAARWCGDRWMTAQAFVAHKDVYAYRIEFPPPDRPDEEDVDSSHLV